jgi:protein-S-isoprenylcysteine O-methyltransferase Ste14
MSQGPSPLRHSLGPLIKTAIFTVLVPGTVGVWIPYRLLARADRGFWDLGALRYLGLLPLGLGAAIYFWCAWDFAVAGQGTPAPIDPPKDLVARGLYRWTRNPMYVGVLAVVLGQAVLFEAPILAGYAALVFILFHLFVVLYEEPMLSSKFGEAYDRYRASVPRWLPWRARGA